MGEYINKAKGKIKRVTGKATGDKQLEAKGIKDELIGKVQGAAADVKRAAKNAAKK